MPFHPGRRSEDDLILFHSAMPPTRQTNGHLYQAVFGPFVRQGMDNLQIRTAAERLVRADPRMEQLIIEENMTTEEPSIAPECDARDKREYSPQPTLPVFNRQGFFQTLGAIPCPIGTKTN